jgi:hypothetical protein
MKTSRDPHRGHLVFSAGNARRIPMLALHVAFVHRFILLPVIECPQKEFIPEDFDSPSPLPKFHLKNFASGFDIPARSLANGK